MAEISLGMEKDDWRDSFNRVGSWYDPPVPARDHIVWPRMAAEAETPWLSPKYARGPDGEICYSATTGKWWCYVRYRLNDGRWLVCRSNNSSLSKTPPKFAVVAEPFEQRAAYEAYNDFDWTQLAAMEDEEAGNR